MAEDDLSQHLARLAAGDTAAAEHVGAAVFAELRELARRQLRSERANHTLQPTALVNEAWLKLFGGGPQRFQNKNQFLAVAALAMRRLLVNHAQARVAAKRGGRRERATWTEDLPVAEREPEELIALDVALERLRDVDPVKCQLVELRFFAGVTAEEAAAVLGMSLRTAEREWRLARAWLRREVEKAEDA